MLLLVITLFLLTLALGAGLLNLSHTFERASLFTLPLDVLASLTIGIGLASVIQFWALWLTGSRTLPFLAEFAIALLFCGLALTRRQWPPLASRAAGKDERRRRTLDVLIFVLVGLLLIVLGMNLVSAATLIPHGKWDAWAIWNLRARFLLTVDAFDTAFSGLLGWSHTDYPLLLPLSVTRLWTFLETQSQFAPLVLSVLFTVTTMGVLFFAIASLASAAWGAFGLLLLIAHTNYLREGLAQFADVPLGLYFLLTLTLFAFYDQGDRKRMHFILLAGVVTGLAAWTKNEGLLFILAIAAGRFTRAVTDGDRGSVRHEAACFLRGLAPVGVTLVVFKARFAFANDLFGQNAAGLFERLTLFDRYQMTLERFLAAYGGIGGGILLWLLALVALSLWQKHRFDEVFVTPLITLLVMHLGYFMIYILTPQNLNTHLVTSLDRLIAQLWPSMVFAGVLLIPRRLERFENRDAA